MRLLRLPGVYGPQPDTEFLRATVLRQGVHPGCSVLDIGTGTGRLGISLATAGAGRVVAVDLSRRAVWSARANSSRARAGLRVRRADLWPTGGSAFDVIVANPPYVPCPDAAPARGPARAWDAGPDGRRWIDRICRGARIRLQPGGVLWLVHSGLCGPQRTVDVLADGGLAGEIVDKEEIPFGPVLRARADWMRAEGMLEPEEDTEQLVVLRGRRTDR